ncbi:hypothetical protein P3S67_010019 [Capsicum chacoense]
MAERLNINKITPAIGEWICKVQVIDKVRPRDGQSKKKINYYFSKMKRKPKFNALSSVVI